MPYKDHLRFDCKLCGRPRKAGERFSARGKCSDCGEARMIDEHRQLRSSSGEHFEHWLARCRAAFGVVGVVERHRQVDDDRDAA